MSGTGNVCFRIHIERQQEQSIHISKNPHKSKSKYKYTYINGDTTRPNREHFDLDNSTITNLHADNINTNDVIDIDLVGTPNLNDLFNEDHSFNILSPIDRGRGFKLANFNLSSLPQTLDQLRILLRETTIGSLSLNEGLSMDRLQLMMYVLLAICYIAKIVVVGTVVELLFV